MKYAKPDTANSVREIAWVTDGSTKQKMKSLFSLISYVLDTKNMRPIISHKSSLTSAEKMVAFCDSDYAGNSGR
jgi:hypothetical protein